MEIQVATPKFVSIERTNDYGQIKKVIIRVDHIEHVEVSFGIVYLLNETRITNITRESMTALEEALVGSNESKRDESPMIQF
jgi:hypothetical protein